MSIKTKEDVEKNLPRLGKGVSVFICYAQNPKDPYSDPKPLKITLIHYDYVNKITQLICDLECFGFTVISDCHLDDSQPSYWLQWYVSRIELCDFLIMVGSPAFKEVFSLDRPKRPVRDEQVSWLFAYCVVVHKEITEKTRGSKFIPVTLGELWSVDDCFPKFLSAGSVYQLGHMGKRTFEYKNRANDGFESMICRMADITEEIDTLGKGKHIFQMSYLLCAHLNISLKTTGKGGTILFIS